MTSSNDGDDDTSLTLASASSYPILRRVDQQFVLENKLADYGQEISRVSGKNKTALAAISSQERRILEMQARLRGSSVLSNQQTVVPSANNTIAQHRKQDPRINTINNVVADNTKRQLNTKQIEPDNSYLRNEVTSNAIITSSADKSSSNHVDSVLDSPPTNLRISKVGHDSFTAEWDNNHDETIIDYEIKYSYSFKGEEKQVLLSCSRWCLKEPLPHGRCTVQNLEPNTQYRDIAVRCRRNNSLQQERITNGWSNFSNSLSITTAQKDEGHDNLNRRSKFLFRIRHIEGTIQSLEAARQKIPAEQVLLARNMSHMQNRIEELSREIERVVSHGGNELLSCHLLHGSDQSFTKATLKRKLEKEHTTCRQNIAQLRAGIIDLDKESSELAEEIQEEETKLNERKAALLKFDRQYAIVSDMKDIVSTLPSDIKGFFFAQWRIRVKTRLHVKSIIEGIARSCKRRVYAVAWIQLCSLVSSRREAESRRRNVDADGIGGLLLNVARCSVEETLSDADKLIGVINNIKVNQYDGEQQHFAETTIRDAPCLVLCKEDEDLLVKGGFLFNAGHYESSLKCFQELLSKMETSSKESVALFSEINGRIGHVHIKLRCFDLGIVYFGRQLSLAEEEDLDPPRIEALIGLGTCYLEKFDYAYAETLLKRALDLSLANGDGKREIISYKILQKCCLQTNRRAEAAGFAAKIQSMNVSSWDRESGGTAISRKAVDNTLQELNDMRARLIDVIAKQGQVVQLEIASAHRVHLQKTKSDKEHQLQGAREELSVSKELSKELNELIRQIESEIYAAKHTKKNRFMSKLIQGSNQAIKTNELLIRLDEELKISKQKHEDCLAAIPRTEMLIHNTKDDIRMLEEELSLEQGPLMKRVLQRRNYRCISLNEKKAIDNVAVCEGSNCYIHDLKTGKLHHVFTCDEQGSSAATVTALFLYGDRVYTGTNSVLIGWDTTTSKQLFVAKGHEAAITCIYCDDAKIVSGSADKCIIVWSHDGVFLRRVSGHSHGVHSIECGPSYCVSSSYSTVYVWDVVTEEKTDKIRDFNCRQRLVLSEGNVTTLCFGVLEIITGDNRGFISVWWIESGEQLQNFKVHDGAVTSIQVDATKAVTCGADMVVAISDVIRGQVLQKLRGHNAPILALAFDSTQITSISSDGELRVWSWENRSGV